MLIYNIYANIYILANKYIFLHFVQFLMKVRGYNCNVSYCKPQFDSSK